MDDDKELVSFYNRKYYEEHKEELKERRKKKYREDARYRKRQLAGSAKQYKKKAKMKKKLVKKGLIPKRKKRVLGPRKPKLFRILVGKQEVVVKMYGIGQMAVMLDRDPGTLRSWEKRGILPEPLYRDENGARLYTELQMDKIRAAYKYIKRTSTAYSFRRLGTTKLPELFKEIWEKWPLGVDNTQL